MRDRAGAGGDVELAKMLFTWVLTVLKET